MAAPAGAARLETCGIPRAFGLRSLGMHRMVHARQPGRILMQWRTPKIVEIACGCEINAYFPADL
jgi:coenzyme PQQ precursor peptide PqqA